MTDRELDCHAITEVHGTSYCLGTSEPGCRHCLQSDNWTALNYMPDPWRRKKQKEMTRVDDTECILRGRIYYT